MDETLTCPRCGASAPLGEWGFHGSTPPVGLAARFCPACGRASVPGRVPPAEPGGQMTVGEVAAAAGATIAPVRAPLEGDRADWTVCDLCGRRGCDCSLGGDAWL